MKSGAKISRSLIIDEVVDIASLKLLCLIRLFDWTVHKLGNVQIQAAIPIMAE
jgi:hypothetical protein